MIFIFFLIVGIYFVEVGFFFDVFDFDWWVNGVEDMVEEVSDVWWGVKGVVVEVDRDEWILSLVWDIFLFVVEGVMGVFNLRVEGVWGWIFGVWGVVRLYVVGGVVRCDVDVVFFESLLGELLFWRLFGGWFFKVFWKVLFMRLFEIVVLDWFGLRDDCGWWVVGVGIFVVGEGCLGVESWGKCDI